MAEDGVIAERYPVVVLPKGGYRQRTRLNVSDSDGTAILYNVSLTSGWAGGYRFALEIVGGVIARSRGRGLRQDDSHGGERPG
jgi:Circularly permutated YpsA SLOG family